MWKRLNRLLLNSDAMRIEANVLVRHLGRDPSNHAPLLMSASTRLDDKSKAFRFWNVWTLNKELLDVISESWSSSVTGSPLHILSAKLCNVKQALKCWSKELFGYIFKEGCREVGFGG